MFLIEDYDLVVEALIQQLKNQKISLSDNNDDGRVNSILNEENIINVALKSYKNIPIFKKMNLILEKQPEPRYTKTKN
ncbi:hypothetical protein [Mycoplasmopsis primatum]|uniref:hypothetical protein n=1 Tax=Mycoplasmopsis primatum TaxID=55604 RepID=UPI0004953C85|nr:hypothetical protein [Mycoplasmopsis primatum]